MLDSGERPLAPQWLQMTRSQPKRTSGRWREISCVTQVQPIRSVRSENQFMRHRHAHRPLDFLDEREEARPGGRKELRRTNSDLQSEQRSSSMGAHGRSQSVWDFFGTRHMLRRTPDSTTHHYPSSSVSSSDSGSSRSLNQTGRSSRLADLPEMYGSIPRHSPESRAELSPTKLTDFSRLIDTPSSNEDVDAAEIQRIYFERSKKLIPMVQARTTGRRSSKSPLTPLGKTSPISSAHQMPRLDATPSGMPSGTPHKEDRRTEREHRDRKTEGKAKEQDRNTFFNSLIKNKSRNEKDTSEMSSHSAHRPDSERDFTGDSSAVVSLDDALMEKKVNNCVIWVVPPQDEEERFLRELGWDASEVVDPLTDEEVAAFYKAQATHRATPNTQMKTDHLHRLQCSPDGHLSSFDLVADSGSEFLSSDAGSL